MTSPPVPDSEDLWARVDAVADAAGPPEDYAAFLASAPTTDDYLFSARLVRFEARPSDYLVAPRDLTLRPVATGIELSAGSLGGALRVAALEVGSARRLLALFDGTRDLAEVRRAAAAEPDDLEQLVSAAFGRMLFAPLEISALESRISGTELTRFVGTPYEVHRCYWENMRDVRELAPVALERVSEAQSFVRALRRLHVVALLGARLDNFYRPASRTSQSVQPGALYTADVRSERRGNETILHEGPRVGVPLLGGRAYHALVCAHDPCATDDEREVHSADGLSWGRVVQGRALHEAESRSWFLPPRPLTTAHFQTLYAAYDASQRAANLHRVEELTRTLARFHFRFVRLHPFRCGNQSLCMNLVNALLLVGAEKCMPHGLLDQFALRLDEPAYEIVFSRAVRNATSGGNASERWAKLQSATREVYTLIERLQKAPDADGARAIAELMPRAAEAALIT